MTRLEQNFREFVCRHSLIKDGESVLLGFSGGADSSALLHLLKSYLDEHGGRLVALHVNHGIRGEEADADEKFCRLECAKLGILFIAKKADVPGIAKEQKKGLEECARDIRYSFFDDVCQEEKIDLVATAHNADDNLETLIFNITRGCGLSGLCGITPRRGNIIRPLLFASKDDIIRFCDEEKIGYVYDSTNSDTAYTRNFIRSEIVPKLKKLNSGVSENTLSLCETVREDNEFIEMISREQNGVFTSDLPDSIIKRMFAREYSEFVKASGCDRRDSLQRVHLDGFASLVRTGRTDCPLSLPGGIHAILKEDGRVLFLHDTREKKKKPEYKDGRVYPLSLGENTVEELGVVIKILPLSEDITDKAQNIYNSSKKQTLTFDTIEKVRELCCRRRLEGDEYKFGGMTRNVKKLISSLKLDSETKKNFPVILDSEGILLVPSFPVRDGNIKKDSQYKYTIQISRIEKSSFGGKK